MYSYSLSTVCAEAESFPVKQFMSSLNNLQAAKLNRQLHYNIKFCGV